MARKNVNCSLCCELNNNSIFFFKWTLGNFTKFCLNRGNDFDTSCFR